MQQPHTLGRGGGEQTLGVIEHHGVADIEGEEDLAQATDAVA